jgi:malate synthase
VAKVREDKQREARAGFDGSWVAHPDLVPVAREAFDAILQDRPNQKQRQRLEVSVTRDQLLTVHIPDASITEAGVRGNVRVALEYLDNWFEGRGAVGIDNLMEDSATAEISRMQLQQWVRHEVTLADGSVLTRARYVAIRDQELERLLATRSGDHQLREAVALLDRLVDQPIPEEFLTLGAYEYLTSP